MNSITIPQPFSAHGLLYVMSGYVAEAVRPVYAIRPGAAGDISLADGETSSEFVAWYQDTAGPYHPTPLVYGDYYFTLLDRGFFTVHDALSGEELYLTEQQIQQQEVRRRVARGTGGFTASPVGLQRHGLRAERGGRHLRHSTATTGSASWPPTRWTRSPCRARPLRGCNLFIRNALAPLANHRHVGAASRRGAQQDQDRDRGRGWVPRPGKEHSAMGSARHACCRCRRRRCRRPPPGAPGLCAGGAAGGRQRPHRQRSRSALAGHVGAARQRRRRAAQLVDVLRHARQPALQPARPGGPGFRRGPGVEVGLLHPPARPRRDDRHSWSTASCSSPSRRAT